jgi:hypothetical protein
MGRASPAWTCSTGLRGDTLGRMCDFALSISVLDAGDVRTFIRQHTSLQAATVKPLGAGMGSVAWRVDREWVARFPLTVDAAVGG